jgi:hypothetical protein
VLTISYDDIVVYIEDQGFESVTLFKDPSYDSAFIGISSDDKPVYDYDKMLEFLQRERGMTIEEAMDFISFNDSYRNSDTPIILYRVTE